MLLLSNKSPFQILWLSPSSDEKFSEEKLSVQDI